MLLKITIFFLLAILVNNSVLAQNHAAKTDSTKIYKDIQSYSKRSKFTNFIYGILFKQPASTANKKSSKKIKNKKVKERAYSNFEGKIIRNINIETLDPFGYSVSDTNTVTQNGFLKIGNKLHIKSQHITIRNLLLIRENQVFDSLLVKESERLVRSKEFVHDVSFSVASVSSKSDSVDIFIRELDNWTLVPGFSISPSQVTLELKDKNIAGLGHESQDGITWFHTTGRNAYHLNYIIPNIRNTYINTTLMYNNDEYDNIMKSVSVDRPFYSPFAKWAAGVKFMQQFNNVSIQTSDSFIAIQPIKFNTQDYWAGYAIQMFKGNTENDRSTNFISSLRLLRIHYEEKPLEIYNHGNGYANEVFYITGFGISTRKYVQEKYLFKFGVTEDVPVGQVYSIIAGYQEKNNSGRTYLGARFSLGRYIPWGYLSSSYEYGTFLRASHAEQGIFSASIIYFTDLLEIGKWKFRQFVKPQLMIGFNRMPEDTLTLHEGNGLDGFNSTALTGTNRLLFTWQTQSYAPWNLIGFKFGPYLSYSVGMLGDGDTGFRGSRVYSQIGIGVQIKNEYLVFGSFQISISFYPSIPGLGQNIYKFNSIKTTDFKLRDFDFGKPEIISFQ